MTELGEIQLRGEAGVYGARRKIRSIALLAGATEIDATRVATAVSQAARRMIGRDGEPRIRVALGGSGELVLSFVRDRVALELPGLSVFFDEVRESEGVVIATKRILDAVERTDRFLADARARVGERSRDELMAEVQETNRALAEHSARLEATVEQRTSELRSAMEAAEEANESKSRFLANMSHELRTPMNAIIGYSEMLIEDATDAGEDDVASDLRKIHTAGNHLLALINDVLDLSKIEAGRMELYLETFDVVSVIEGVASTVQALVEQRGNELTVEIDPAVQRMRADLTKVRQCLFNLLSNAAKFTEKGRVAIRVVRDGDDVLFAVSDSGIGIPQQKLENIFDEFSQADESTTRNFGGTGLGLAITLRFCRMMGGDVRVESRPGEGSTFTLRIPVHVRGEEEEELAPEVEEVRDAAGHGPRVLVIDDDPFAVELLTRTLQGAGLRVASATDGEQALELARTLQPSAITLDVLMPGMDGWSVLDALKSDPRTCEIPVIMCSMTDDRDLGLALGATEFLTKPIDRERLVALFGRFATADGKRDVLVVDDSHEVRDVVRRTMERDGWTVREAVNGRDALDRLDEGLPALVLLDLMMPVMDGFEFVEHVRQNEALRSLPIIVVTAKTLTDADRQRLNGGVEGLIEKSGVDANALMEQLRSQISSHIEASHH